MPSDGVETFLDVLGRRRHLVVTAVLVAAAARHGFDGFGDWTTVTDGVDLLFGIERRWLIEPGGWSLYANYPEIQFGPVSLLVAAPFVAMGGAGRVALGVVLLVVGLAIHRAVDAMAGADDDPAIALRSAIAGILFAATWPPLASGFFHVDDAIALAACVAAVAAIRRDRILVAGLLIGIATAAKPWALILVPMLWANGRRDAWRGLLAAGAVTAIAWGPFVLGDTATLGAGKPTVDVSAASVLHLVGVPLGLAPEWLRGPQLLLALVLAAITVWRGNWYAVPLVAVAARMAVDPGTYSYYTSGLLATALIRDLLGPEQRLPWASTIAFLTVYVPEVALIDRPAAQAVLRLVGCVGLIAIGMAGAGFRIGARPADPARPAPA